MKTRIVNIVTILLTLVTVITVFSVALSTVNHYHHETSYDALLEQKKTYIKESVNNQIIKIDQYILNYEHFFYDNADAYIEGLLDESLTIDELEIRLEGLTSYFTDAYLIQIYESNVLIHNPSNSTYDLSTLSNAGLNNHKIYVYGTYQILMGIYQSDIDELVFNRIKSDILEAKYEDHTYMWVNQILNYDGGEDYAVRFIHPNATPQSGTLLSTNTVVNGKMPYLEELEGVKKDGEVYFTYHFTLPGSDELAEKITYAKLYERYDFVIAMGIYIEDINVIIATQQAESYQFSVCISLIFIVIFFITFGINFFINYKINQSKVEDLSHTLIQESNKDELTSAYLRRVAIKDFEVFHDKLLKNKQLVIGFALFDIDYFKQINDTYGHKIGDTILKDLVKLLNHTVINDNIYRWGGDEFILIIESDSEEKVIQTIKEIMHQVAALRFIDEAALSITLSLGLTFISKLDKSIDDTVFRADKALYKAKSSGRNQIKVCEE